MSTAGHLGGETVWWLTLVIPATLEVEIREGSWLEASWGKKFERPHLN
jgi:hypothetical protein